MIRKKWSFHTTLFAVLTLGLLFSGCDLLGSDDDDDDDTPVEETKYAAADTIDVGAQGHLSLGTAMDFDDPKALPSQEANQQRENLDALFVFHDSMIKLMSPLAAKNANITVAGSYPATVPNTMFVKVGSKPASLEAANTAYAAGTPSNTVSISANDVIITKTTQGKTVVVEILSIIGGNASDATGRLAVSVTTL